jgi:hypothetical protein
MDIINLVRDSIKYYDKTETIIPKSFAVINNIADLDQYSANLDPIKDAGLFYFSKWEKTGSNLSKFNYTFPIVALLEIDIDYIDTFIPNEREFCRTFGLFILDYEKRYCKTDKNCFKRNKSEILQDCYKILSKVISFIYEGAYNTEGELKHQDDPTLGVLDLTQTNRYRKSLRQHNNKNVGRIFNHPTRQEIYFEFKVCNKDCSPSNPTFLDKQSYTEQGCC